MTSWGILSSCIMGFEDCLEELDEKFRVHSVKQGSFCLVAMYGGYSLVLAESFL